MAHRAGWPIGREVTLFKQLHLNPVYDNAGLLDQRPVGRLRHKTQPVNMDNKLSITSMEENKSQPLETISIKLNQIDTVPSASLEAINIKPNQIDIVPRALTEPLTEPKMAKKILQVEIPTKSTLP